MFELYKDGQPVAVSILENAIRDNKLSHAYLIDTNHYSKAFEFILDFIKQVVLSEIENLDEYDSICHRIDSGNYSELNIIEAEGNWIKKEQMSDLQENFSLKGVEGTKRFYIIKDCEKMNVQTSNSILKFLEEPDDNVIAILMSNNISQILDTIVSRCQLIRLNCDKSYNESAILNLCDLLCLNDGERSKFLDNETNKLLVDEFLRFIKEYINRGTGIISDIKKLWHDKFNNRNKVDIAIDLWINLYYDILRMKNNLKVVFYVDYEDEIKNSCSFINSDKLLLNIDTLIEFKSYLRYNLNLNLFIDKLIIDMVGD